MIDTNYQDALLSHAMLSSLACTLPTMDPRRVKSMGITPEQAQKIAALTSAEVVNLATNGAHFLRIAVDAEVLDEQLTAISGEADRDALINDFVRQGASREMMTEFFGINHRRFARLRQTLGQPTTTGRPRECTLQNAERVLDAWQARGSGRDPKTLLEIAHELDLSLRMIWDEIDHYDTEASQQQAPVFA